MEVNDDLLNKALEQAIASVLLEFDMDIDVIVDTIKRDKEKVLVLKGDVNGEMGRLYNRKY